MDLAVHTGTKHAMQRQVCELPCWIVYVKRNLRTLGASIVLCCSGRKLWLQ